MQYLYTCTYSYLLGDSVIKSYLCFRFLFLITSQYFFLMFKGHPKGLFALALANTGERFGYYTMLAIFVLFLQAKFGFDTSKDGDYYSWFLAAVYFTPLLGGFIADKWLGFGKTIMIGIVIMFLGYLLLSIPNADRTTSLVAMVTALALISLGTGLFKGNLQVLVGNLYDDPQ